MRNGRSVLAFAVVFSLALHAAALAALLTDWRKDPIDDVAVSVELVIVSAPVDSPADNSDPAPQAAGIPTPSAEPAPQAIEQPAPPPPPQVAEPAPVPAPVPTPAPPPKPAPKPQIAKPTPPKPQPAPPRNVEPPINLNLNPGFAAGDDTQQAKAPSGGQVSPSFSVLHGPIPPYPAAARSRGQEGRVALEVTIAVDGTPSSVVLGRSSGSSLLDESALTTVKTWRFRNDSGHPINITVPIVFELRSTAGR